MVLIRLSTVFRVFQIIMEKTTLSLKFLAGLFFLFVFLAQPVQAFRATPASSAKSYLRIESSELYEQKDEQDESDLKVATFGFIGFDKDMAGHLDLTYLESAKEGNGFTLDAGGAYAFSGYASLYVGLGLALGYNLDNDEFIATYYPEAGIVVDITNSFGLSLSAKRYFNLNSNTEDVIMLGLVFR